MRSMNIRRNDTVLVTRGKDRGKRGRVLSTDPVRRRVLVEGVNLLKKHVRPNPNIRQAGIVEQPGLLSVANVKLVCEKCGKPSRTGHGILTLEEGGVTRTEKVRICKSCKEQIE